MDTAAPAAGEGVRAEVAAIATDTNHPMYFGYHRGDARVMSHIDSLYEKSVGKAPVHIGAEGIDTGDIVDQARRATHPAASETPTDSQPQSLIDESTLTPEQRTGLAMAQEEFGPDAANRLNEALSAREHILQMPEGMAMFTAWDPFIDQLGDLGEAFVWECLSVVNKYAKRATNNGGR